MRAHVATIGALVRRALNELIRVPGAAIPGVLAPTIFGLGLTAVFGSLTALPGFTTDDYFQFLLPVGLLQAAAFTGAATGVNTARDIEQGWFDRLLVAPPPRWVLFAGIVLSAGLRALLPMTLLLTVGFALGVPFPGVGALVLAVALAATFAIVASSWGLTLALRFRTQQAAPLMQAGVFMAVLFTPSYAPRDLLTGWLQDVATVNPITQVMEAIRTAFIEDPSWAETWPGLVALAGLAAVLVTLALRGLERATA